MIPWQVLQRCGETVVAAFDALDRVVGWVSPVQGLQQEALRRSLEAHRLNGFEAERDALEPGELRHRFYCNRCGGGYYTGTHECLRENAERRAALGPYESVEQCAPISWPEESSAPDGGVELPREHDLDPRRWEMPNGTIIREAVNREAVELLKNDPDEYFRRTKSSAAGAGADTSPTPPPLVGDNDSAGAQPPSAPAESPNSREQYMAESDAVVAQFNAAEDKQLRLVMDVQQAVTNNTEYIDGVTDWIDVVYELQANWDIQPREKKTAAG